jgi:hypothetical protein
MRFRRTILLILGTVVLAVSLSPASAVASADIDAAKLSKVKAAFLLNFVKFTTWPHDQFSSDKAPLIVAVVGQDDLDGVLDATLRGREWNGHPIQIVRIPSLPAEGHERQDSLRSLGNSHVIYVAPSAMLRSNDLKTLNQNAVLTIAFDAPQTRQGTILGFAVEQGKVSFVYNANAAKDSPLQISSKLLTLARNQT